MSIMSILMPPHYFVIAGYAVLLMMYLAIIAFRNALAKQMLGAYTNTDASPTTNEAYRKQVTGLGWILVGVLTSCLAAGALSVIRYAPQDIHATISIIKPWAIGIFILGFTAFAVGTMRIAGTVTISRRLG